MSDNQVKFVVRGRFVDPNGKDLGPAGKTDSKPAETDPVLRTGNLPGNITGAPKLKEADILTYERLREATDEQVTAAGLEAEQITRLREIQNAPAK